ARWADAVAAREPGGERRFVPVRLETTFAGTWEVPVGDNNKLALSAGLVEAADEVLAVPSPATAEVRWADGTTVAVPQLDAAATLAELRAEGGPCPDCAAVTPLRVTGARPTTTVVPTDQGDATVPAWEFGLEGTAVRLVRPAVAASAVTTLPPSEYPSTPFTPRVDEATVSPDGRVVTAAFVGGPESGPCATAHEAHAVESELAVVLVVVDAPAEAERAGAEPGAACTAIGYRRTARVTLSAPLGERTLLDVGPGTPIRTTG
ncbi:MAG TPA: hypothetical protein VGD67_22065, partial [Pseudonocardiaceae bacterium]